MLNEVTTENPKKFDRYAEFYSVLYKDRNYSGEVSFVHELIKTYYKGNKTPLKLIDLGCGTGEHLRVFSGLGYDVAGSDILTQMIGVAKENLNKENIPCNLYNYSFVEVDAIPETFDIAVSFFTAFGYLLKNEDQRMAIRNIYDRLNKDGLFIFDIWNGHAVTQDKSPLKVLRKQGENYDLLRLSETKLDLLEQIADVNFTWFYNKDGLQREEYKEHQRIYFYYLQEIKNLLLMNDFKILKICPFLNINGEVDTSTFNISIVAMKA